MNCFGYASIKILPANTLRLNSPELDANTQNHLKTKPANEISASRSSITSRTSSFFLGRTRAPSPSTQIQLDAYNEKQSSDEEISANLLRYTKVIKTESYTTQSPPTSCLERTIEICQLRGTPKENSEIIQTLERVIKHRLEIDPNCRNPKFITLGKSIVYFQSGRKEPLTIREITRTPATHLPNPDQFTISKNPTAIISQQSRSPQTS